MVTIPTKDVGDVKDCFRDINYKSGLEDGNEYYIKRNLGLE